MLVSWRFNHCTMQILAPLFLWIFPMNLSEKGIKAWRSLGPSWLSTKALGEHPAGSRSCPKMLVWWNYHGAMQGREEHDSIHTHHTTKSERRGGVQWTASTGWRCLRNREMGSGTGLILIKYSEMTGWRKYVFFCWLICRVTLPTHTHTHTFWWFLMVTWLRCLYFAVPILVTPCWITAQQNHRTNQTIKNIAGWRDDTEISLSK